MKEPMRKIKNFRNKYKVKNFECINASRKNRNTESTMEFLQDMPQFDAIQDSMQTRSVRIIQTAWRNFASKQSQEGILEVSKKIWKTNMNLPLNNRNKEMYDFYSPHEMNISTGVAVEYRDEVDSNNVQELHEKLERATQLLSRVDLNRSSEESHDIHSARETTFDPNLSMLIDNYEPSDGKGDYGCTFNILD